MKRGNTGKLIYPFKLNSCLEVKLENGTWARVTERSFRSFAGERRISYLNTENQYVTEPFDGPVYLYGTNTLADTIDKGIRWVDEEERKEQSIRIYDRKQRYQH